MKRKWRTSLVYALLFGIVAVTSWSAFLVFRWYQAYSTGRLIGNEATSIKPPGGISEWVETGRRHADIDEQVNRLAPWQRDLALTTAVESWAASPRNLSGSMYLWNLLFRHDQSEFMRRMVDVSLPEPWPVMPDSDRMFARLERLQGMCLLPLYLAGPDRPINSHSRAPTVGEPFARSLSEFAATNGMRWKIVGQAIALGTDEELAEFERRGRRRTERMKECEENSRHMPSTPRPTEKLAELLVLRFSETPLYDVLDFLCDYLGVNIRMCSPRHGTATTLSERREIPISVHVEEMTCAQSLDCLLMPIGLDWEVIDEIITIGTAEELVDFSGRSARTRELIVRSLNASNPFVVRVGEELDKPVSIPYSAGTLGEVIKFLQEYAEVAIFALEAHEQTSSEGLLDVELVPSTLSTVTVATALDCLLDQKGFDWDVVGEFVCLGGPSDIDRFRRRLSESDRSIQNASESVATFLNTSLGTACNAREPEVLERTVKIHVKRIEPGEYSTEEILRHFFAAHLPAFPPTEFGDVICGFPAKALPVYRALDAVCECTSLRWEPTKNGGIRVFE